MYWMDTDTGIVPSGDIYVQGTKVLSAFNSVTVAGGYGLAVTRSFTATVSGTTFTLKLVGVGAGGTFVDLNAVSIVEVGGGVTVYRPVFGHGSVSGAGVVR